MRSWPSLRSVPSLTRLGPQLAPGHADDVIDDDVAGADGGMESIMGHRKPSRSVALPLAAAVVLGLLASSTLVWQASRAAFTATTTNPGNTFSAGAVALSDSRNGTAMFTPPAGMVPNDTGNACIDVTFTGDVPTGVRLYSSDPTGNLGLYLVMKIEEGPTSKACGDAAGWTVLANQSFEAFYAIPHDSWANGVSSWAPSVTGTRRFKFTYTLADDNNAQGQTTAVIYTWEARNT